MPRSKISKPWRAFSTSLQMGVSYCTRITTAIPESHLLLDRYMEVLSPDGQVLLRNDRLHGMDLGGAPAPREGEVGYKSKRMHLADGTPALAISHLHILQGNTSYYQARL